MGFGVVFLLYSWGLGGVRLDEWVETLLEFFWIGNLGIWVGVKRIGLDWIDTRDIEMIYL